MKHYKDAIIHGAQLFRHLKGQQTSENKLALAKLPFAAARIAVRSLSRRAAAEEEAEEGDGFFGSFEIGEDESGDDFFSALLGGGNDDSVFMENFEQCGIDVEEMTGKAMGAFFLYGSDFDMSSPESFVGSDAYGPMLLALKDDDEEECSATDSAKFLLASNEYLQCSGMNDFFYSGVEFQSIEDDCKPVFDMVTTVDILSLQQDILDGRQQDFIDEESAFGQSSKRCLQTFLGDNAMGNFIRYQYNNIDKTFGCFSKLGEDLPHCVLGLPVQDGDPMSLPISLEKKLACVLGSSYESSIVEACVGMFEGLDKCLPQSDDATDVDDAISSCAVEEGILIGKQDDLLGMDASVVTGNKMPDFCSKIFDEQGMDAEELQSRLEYYNKNREYGWTIESIVNDVKEEVEEVIESPEESQALYKSNPVGISSEEYTTWTDGEAAPEDDVFSQKKYLPFLVVGLVIAATVLLALIVKHRRSGSLSVRSHSTSNNNSRKDYANLSVKMFELA